MTTPRVSEPQPGPARDVAAAVAELAGAQSWAELGALLLARADELRAARRAPELAAWIALIPPALRGPRLSLALARCLADQGAYDPAVLALDGSLADPALDPAAARELALCKAGLEQVRGEYASADALVLPYLADPSAPPLDRARALRIHGIGLVFQGADDRALLALEQAAALARAGGPSRLLGLALHDFGNAAARLGRYLLAERTLRLAQEVWTQLGAPPDLASTLGLRALVALNAGRPGEARDLAQSAFDLALSHGRGREIAGALAVQGEIAAAAQDWPAARRCFEQAEVECQRAGVIEGGALCFALAMQSLIARQLADLRRLGELLPLLAAAQPATPLERAWIAAGQAAARMSLGVAGAAEALDEAACLGAGPMLASGMLLILRAQAS
ncbi:MAG TPA: tetratricopeptide repeat protein, partial [Herpetosiphonaceae bacterium]